MTKLDNTNETLTCPSCKGTGKSPSTPRVNCLCCKGEKVITKTHLKALKSISKNLQDKLNEKLNKKFDD